MIQLFQALNVLLPLIYGLSLGFYVGYFNTKTPLTRKLSSRVLLAGISCHIAFIISKGVYFKYFPIANSFEALSMVALNIGIIYYIIEKTIHEGRTGVFFLTIAFSFQLISSMFTSGFGTSNPLLSNPMFGIHTTLTLLGISALAISSLYGLMYLMLSKEIKRHHFGAIYNGLPPLEILETMGRYAVGYGILLLGVGILLGHLWAYRVLGYFFMLDLKIILTDLVWLMYATGWIIARHFGLRGLRMSVLSFLGFLIFLISIIIVNIAGSTFHRFI